MTWQHGRQHGATVAEAFHNHHDLAWRETHDGRELRIVRKGVVLRGLRPLVVVMAGEGEVDSYRD